MCWKETNKRKPKQSIAREKRQRCVRIYTYTHKAAQLSSIVVGGGCEYFAMTCGYYETAQFSLARASCVLYIYVYTHLFYTVHISRLFSLSLSLCFSHARSVKSGEEYITGFPLATCSPNSRFSLSLPLSPRRAARFFSNCFTFARRGARLRCCW